MSERHNLKNSFGCENTDRDYNLVCYLVWNLGNKIDNICAMLGDLGHITDPT